MTYDHIVANRATFCDGGTQYETIGGLDSGGRTLGDTRAPIRLAAATESGDCSPRDGVRTLVAFGRAERPESELLFILFGKRRGVCVGMGR